MGKENLPWEKLNKVNEIDSVCQTCGNPLSPLANEVLKNIDKIKSPLRSRKGLFVCFKISSTKQMIKSLKIQF